MERTVSSRKLTTSERLTAASLKLLPYLAFVLCAFPLPAYFLARYLTATEEVGVYMLLTLTSLAVGSFVGLVVAIAIILFRKRWFKRLRDKLATDGVTVDELDWFKSELTAEERATLDRMKRSNPLLADAYRDTLAARVTATRLHANARRDVEAVERRLADASRLETESRAALERELALDRERLERVMDETSKHRAEMETRLHTIEALAARNASVRDTELALARLGAVSDHAPLSLSNARLELEERERATRELRSAPSSGEGDS